MSGNSTFAKRDTLARWCYVVLLVCALTACSSGKSTPRSSKPTSTSTSTPALSDPFCAVARAAVDAENSVDLEHGSPASVRRTAIAAIAAVRAAQKTVPKDLAPAWATLLVRLESFQRILAANNYDVTAFKSSPAGKQLLNDPDLGQAFQRLDAYFATKCQGAR